MACNLHSHGKYHNPASVCTIFGSLYTAVKSTRQVLKCNDYTGLCLLYTLPYPYIVFPDLLMGDQSDDWNEDQRRWIHQQDKNLLVYFLLLFHLWTVSGKQKSAKAHKLFYCQLYHAREEQNYLNTIFSDSNTFILACRFRSSLYKPSIKMGIKIWQPATSSYKSVINWAYDSLQDTYLPL